MFKRRLKFSPTSTEATLQRILRLVVDSAIKRPSSACKWQQRAEIPLYSASGEECGKIEVLLAMSYDPSSKAVNVPSFGTMVNSTRKSYDTPTESKPE